MLMDDEKELDGFFRIHPAAHQEEEDGAHVSDQKEGTGHGQRQHWCPRRATIAEHGHLLFVDRESTCSIHWIEKHVIDGVSICNVWLKNEELTVVSQLLRRGRLFGNIEDENLLRQRHIFIAGIQLERNVNVTFAATPRVDSIATPLTAHLFNRKSQSTLSMKEYDVMDVITGSQGPRQ